MGHLSFFDKNLFDLHELLLGVHFSSLIAKILATILMSILNRLTGL